MSARESPGATQAAWRDGFAAWLFVSDEPASAPRLAAPDRGCALPVLDAKEKP
jgi:hypothetical protein